MQDEFIQDEFSADEKTVTLSLYRGEGVLTCWARAPEPGSAYIEFEVLDVINENGGGEVLTEEELLQLWERAMSGEDETPQ